MQISGEGKIGIGLGLLSLAGAGAIVIAPQHTEIGWGMIAVAAIGAILLGYHHFDNRMERRGSIFLIVAIVCAVIFDSWYFWTTYRSQPTPPPPAPTAKPSPPPPPKLPWLTDEETEQQKKLGHAPLIIFSPEEILGLWANGQNIGIYLFKWIKVDYPAVSTPTPETLEKKDYYVVRMNINSGSFFSRGSISAYFDPKKWGDRLLTLRQGDRLKAYCQFQGFDRTVLSKDLGIFSDKMIAYNCDLL
jgi:hypothetical protein